MGKRSATKIIQKPIFYCVLNVCTAPLGVGGTCKEWRDLLCPDPLQQVNQQLSANRNARHQLELDLENKLSALSIDHTAHNLHNNSRCSINTLFSKKVWWQHATLFWIYSCLFEYNTEAGITMGLM